MTPLVERLQAVPYRRGASGWDGCDCWGLVENWYASAYGIELAERGAIEPGPHGLAEGFSAQADWRQVEQPCDGDVVVMRKGHLPAGHCGIFLAPRSGHGPTASGTPAVLHTDERHGAVLQPLSHPMIARRVTGYWRHRRREA